MTEEQKVVNVQRMYVKDISLEVPNAPAVYSQKFEPKINVQINSHAEDLSGGLFDVTLTVTLTAEQDEKTVYIVEVKQAGVFELKGFSEQDRNAVLATFCPAQLYPFARESVADLVQRGGFPQFLMQPVNFDAIYQQQLQQMQSAQKEANQEIKH